MKLKHEGGMIMGRMENKVALITGAGSGIGKASALRLAKEGAKIILTDINADNLKEVANEISSFGSESIYFTHDVSKESEWATIVEEGIKAFSEIHVLVNSAGISNPGATMDDYNRIVSINLTGSYLGMRYLIPHMKEIGNGSIINIASLAALGGGGFNGYAASKGGIRAISRAAAIDHAKDNIRVNSVYPGLIITGMTEKILDHEQMKDHFLSTTPLNRFGTGEDIANGVLYLASDEASFVTGSELVIDGGTTAS